MVPKSISKTGV